MAILYSQPFTGRSQGLKIELHFPQETMALVSFISTSAGYVSIMEMTSIG